ncbi:arsenic resistance protein [Achromobacter seleniivolatilans]|uniref:Arsenic resistance protein n=1 Tax=Achromobacter seleniivolatilans TaxID=3047478 RepID=A0ABY9LYD3_9BURK|nr:arsenic resistance protein [Achromobacter sp. R39]WMD19700.1 arsenic resistance protein [Achromobacter sp. R39]
MSSANLRDLLETRQISVYFVAVSAAFVTAFFLPATRGLAVAIEPLLALMLFVTFLQVPMGELRQAMTNVRFVGALITANFVAIPVLVAILLPWLPGESLIRIGFLLVVLTPCIDYVVTFAHLGRADARALLAATPILLVGQMLLLPLYLQLFLGGETSQLVSWEPFIYAFVWLIAVPLVLAAACQAWATRSNVGSKVTEVLGLLPVPATAAVLAVVVAAVTPELGQALIPVGQVVPLYIAFALLSPVVGWIVARAWRLPAAQRLAVGFSAATRNSLVVLPLALAIPGAIPILPAVIVTQTLIELVAELVYVKFARRACNNNLLGPKPAGRGE